MEDQKKKVTCAPILQGIFLYAFTAMGTNCQKLITVKPQQCLQKWPFSL